MTKILILNASCSKNRGSAAMLISTTKTLKTFIPDANITLLSPFPELDLKNCSAYNIKVIGHHKKRGVMVSLRRIFFLLIMGIAYRLKLNINKSINDKLLQEFISSDVIVDLRGDTFSDDYGIMSSIMACRIILLFRFLKVPIVIYAQSIGPFNTKLTKSLSKFCLNRVNLLIVRDEITKNYLCEIGVANTIHLTADPAFLLGPSPCEIVQKILLKENIKTHDRPMIGISASQHIYELVPKKPEANNLYLKLMVQTVGHVVNKLNAHVIFVPHVTNDDRPIDDRFVAKKIYEMSKNKDKIRLINNEYSAEELKGIIGKCDLFIGARMHANIAATSMCVPTLAIAYSHKSCGIMRMLGMEKYVLDFGTMTLEEITSKIDDLWINRERIRMELASKVKVLKDRALYNGKLIKDLVDSLH